MRSPRPVYLFFSCIVAEKSGVFHSPKYLGPRHPSATILVRTISNTIYCLLGFFHFPTRNIDQLAAWLSWFLFQIKLEFFLRKKSRPLDWNWDLKIDPQGYVYVTCKLMWFELFLFTIRVLNSCFSNIMHRVNCHLKLAAVFEHVLILGN